MIKKPKTYKISLGSVRKMIRALSVMFCQHRKLEFLGYHNDGYNEDWSEWKCRNCGKEIQKD